MLVNLYIRQGRLLILLTKVDQEFLTLKVVLKLQCSSSLWIPRSCQMHERSKRSHSNFKRFVCLQPESYEKVGASDMFKMLK